METFENRHIEEVPLSSPFFHSRVERFLQANGLRMETLDVYYTLQNTNNEILAGAGLSGDVLKCVAVAPEARSEGLVAPLVSHILSQHGAGNLKVFTKPEHEAVFASLGFRVIARAPLAILMENGRGLERYCAYLRTLAADAGALPGSRTGVIVMNANPFTLGHRYLIEQAAAQVDRLVLIPVKEDVSAFSYAERVAMLKAGSAAVLPGSSAVMVADGSDYQISAATFPTYFLKDLSDAAETQMRLDLDLFSRHIAPALGADVRFVGSEPSDPLAARYNTLMRELLPIRVVEIPRLQTPDQVGGDGPSCPATTGHLPATTPSCPATTGHPVSASAVRQALARGCYREAAALCPAGTHPYLLGKLADRALRMELDTPSKPGLVGPDGPGAHSDMDYNTMLAGIRALAPFWPRMAMASGPEQLRALGIEAEQAMLSATGGVNTHRGAIFCLGLTVFARSGVVTETPDTEKLMQINLRKTAGAILRNQLKDNNIHYNAPLVGARRMAQTGYVALFEDWLPYYRRLEGTPEREVKTLLRIMSVLDDTCVLKRAGEKRAEAVKREAADLLSSCPATPPSCPTTTGHLQALCAQYAAEGISPGGAADMLALTIFIDSII